MQQKITHKHDYQAFSGGTLMAGPDGGIISPFGNFGNTGSGGLLLDGPDGGIISPFGNIGNSLR